MAAGGMAILAGFAAAGWAQRSGEKCAASGVTPRHQESSKIVP
jgi:hypothetical protein